jgi:trimeric autotransporter adhesin
MTIRRWGNEMTVNTVTAGNQTIPDVAVLGDGRYVVSWVSAVSGNRYSQFQMFGADGSRSGAEGSSSQNLGDLLGSEVTARGYDGFMISGVLAGSLGSEATFWYYTGIGENPYMFYGPLVPGTAAQTDYVAQKLDAPGTGEISVFSFSRSATPSEFGFTVRRNVQDFMGTVGSYVVNDTRNSPHMAFNLAQTDIAIAYHDGGAIHAQRVGIVNDDGQYAPAQGTAVTIAAAGTGDAPNPQLGDVIWLDDDRFVVAWNVGAGAADGSGQGIRYRIYDSATNELGTVLLANTAKSGDQVFGGMSRTADGGFVMVWTDRSGVGADKSGSSIKLQLFDLNGVKIGGEYVVNTTRAGDQVNPSVDLLADGRLIVTWEDNSAGQRDIRQQIVDPRDGLVFGTENADTLFGNDAENDEMTGAGGNDVMNGLAGNDFLDGGAGADTLSGGQGDDAYTVDSTADLTIERAGEGVDTVTTSVTRVLAANLENLILMQGAGDVGGTGNAQNNVLTGNEGNNALNGGAGDDEMTGGRGNDTYTVDSAGDIVVELAGEGTADSVRASVSCVLSAEVENLALTGNGNINGTGNGANNVLLGNAGNNALSGGLGNDTLNGFVGGDAMAGGAGNDLYVVDQSGDSVFEAGGQGTADRVMTGISYVLGANVEILSLTGSANIDGTGNGEANSITGNSGANVLRGMGGNDNLTGGAGNDVLHGGAGNDFYVVDSTADTAIELANEGVDTVSATATFTLGAHIETLVLTGTANIDGTGNDQNNTITGNAGANVLTGGGGNDTLRGAQGNDTLNGGQGNDAMAGDQGNDVYVVDQSGDTALEAADGGIDTVNASVTFTLGDFIENLVLTGSAAISGTGNGLDNTVTGNDSNNNLYGAAGNDTFVGAAGRDRLSGGAGNDTYYVDAVDEGPIEEADGGTTDAVYAAFSYVLGNNIENLVLFGTANIDGTGNGLDNTITGNNGDNALYGLAGADTLIGAGGNDAMHGGEGDDSYVVNESGDTVVELTGEGTDTVTASVTFTLGDFVENLVLTGMATIDGTGNDENNTITGNGGVNTLNGGNGNDTLNGGWGNDTLHGGAGNDTLDGGLDSDAMHGGTGNDTFVVGQSGDTVVELTGEGTDTVNASVAFTLGEFVENLVLTGFANINGTGNDENNTITGNDGNNTLTGGGGHDTLNGGGGNDTMQGGAGNDTFVVDQSGDTVVELTGEGTDTVNASITLTLGDFVENLVLTGTADINGTGNSIDNLINGNAGANVLNGGGGNDTMRGGAGNDTFVVDQSGDTVVELTGEGTDTVNASITFTLGDLVENLVLTGTANINGTGNGGDDAITGNSGANVLNGGDGNDTMRGGAGNDTFIVDQSGDTAIELSGEGTDTVNASISFVLGAFVENLVLTGTDVAFGFGNGTNNVITGNDFTNTLHGNDGDDALNGGDGNDTLFGGIGNDTLNGGLGNDTMEGHSGDDVYFVDQTGDTAVELTSEGTDIVNASITYSLTANIENLVLTGTANIDGTGQDGNNTITGNDGANTLTGGMGKDALNGGGGNDTMRGGAGHDTYVVDQSGDTVVELTGEGSDTVFTSLSDYVLPENVENLTMTGSQSLSSAVGNELDNIIIGNDGSTDLDGREGNDTLTGGGGADWFFLKGLAQGVDTITDFAPSTLERFMVRVDGFGISHARFTLLESQHFVRSSEAVANSAHFQFLYDADDGRLLFDPDGTGAQAAQHIATLSNLANISANNFYMY